MVAREGNCKEFGIAFWGCFRAGFRKSTFQTMLDACPQTQVLSVCLEHFSMLMSQAFPAFGPGWRRVRGVDVVSFL